MAKQIDISEHALRDVVNFWWKKWSAIVNYDTEQEMNFLIPDWIKEIVKKVEDSDQLGAKFNYEIGLWQN